MIKKIKQIYANKKLFDKLNHLNIKESGIDKDGDPFVILNDGIIFYGSQLKSKTYDYLYQILHLETKKVLKQECIKVALDIMIRYVEGGLKYGGPKKQSRYKLITGDYVAEMGAYQGFCSLKLAQQVGPNGRVVAIEPMPDNFRLLKKNKEANNLNQLILSNKGVWDSTKDLVFNRRIGDEQSSSVELVYNKTEHFTVKADTLDNIFEEVGVEAKDFMII
ncbi:FkbM family methyltransferase [Anaerolineales bacterium HSG24]|nr:FkbM family methyltransferase [Anaerolineales bacterium HSG24]